LKVQDAKLSLGLPTVSTYCLTADCDCC